MRIKPWIRTVLLATFLVFLVLGALVWFLARKEVPERITYGMSFNTPYARELGLDPMEVLGALIDDLGIRNFRIAAHWNLIEPRDDVYDFAWMDEELKRIEDAGGTVIFGVGRRLPRWPECHIPEWAKGLSWDDQKSALREYMTTVVNRYKTSSAITYWQVENEPYLTVFAGEHCGETLDEDFLKEQIALVKSLDPTRPLLVTDSGNLGTWNGAYANGDAFGTSVYVYFWNPELGQFRTILPPWFYRAKEKLMRIAHGEKETFLIELALEPWLVDPVAEVPIPIQKTRMSLEKFDEIIAYGEKTRFEKQYLWGGEWWYWLKKQGDDSFWERGRALYTPMSQSK
jgi:hypothetical protein